MKGSEKPCSWMLSFRTNRACQFHSLISSTWISSDSKYRLSPWACCNDVKIAGPSSRKMEAGIYFKVIHRYIPSSRPDWVHETLKKKKKAKRKERDLNTYFQLIQHQNLSISEYCILILISHWNSFSLRLAHLLPQALACYWRSLNSFTNMIYICLFSLHWSREHAHRQRAEKEANHRAAVGQEDTQEKLRVLHGLLPEGTKLQFRSTGHRAQQAAPKQGSPQQQDPVDLLKFITSESHFWLWKP